MYAYNSNNNHMKCSKQEVEIHDFIAAYWWKNGYAPSLDDIAKHIGLPKTNTARYLKLLKCRGLISWKPHFPRTIRIVKPL